MLNHDDPDIFENYDRKLIPGGCRAIDPETGEYEDCWCNNCYGGHPGYCEDYPKVMAVAKAKATTRVLKKAMAELRFKGGLLSDG